MAERSLPSSKFGLSTDFMSPQNQGKNDLFFQLNIYPLCVHVFFFLVHSPCALFFSRHSSKQQNLVFK